jgi:hypothetical protein
VRSLRSPDSQTALLFARGSFAALEAMERHCCEQMRSQIAWRCADHADIFECPDALMKYSDRFDEYGLIVHDGGSSVIAIKFCPWCGSELLESKRDRWFEELEALGFHDPGEQEIPERYLSDAWWRF